MKEWPDHWWGIGPSFTILSANGRILAYELSLIVHSQDKMIGGNQLDAGRVTLFTIPSIKLLHLFVPVYGFGWFWVDLTAAAVQQLTMHGRRQVRWCLNTHELLFLSTAFICIRNAQLSLGYV